MLLLFDFISVLVLAGAACISFDCWVLEGFNCLRGGPLPEVFVASDPAMYSMKRDKKVIKVC